MPPAAATGSSDFWRDRARYRAGVARPRSFATRRRAVGAPEELAAELSLQDPAATEPVRFSLRRRVERCVVREGDGREVALMPCSGRLPTPAGTGGTSGALPWGPVDPIAEHHACPEWPRQGSLQATP